MQQKEEDAVIFAKKQEKLEVLEHELMHLRAQNDHAALKEAEDLKIMEHKQELIEALEHELMQRAHADKIVLKQAKQGQHEVDDRESMHTRLALAIGGAGDRADIHQVHSRARQVHGWRAADGRDAQLNKTWHITQAVAQVTDSIQQRDQNLDHIDMELSEIGSILDESLIETGDRCVESAPPRTVSEASQLHRVIDEVSQRVRGLQRRLNCDRSIEGAGWM